MIDFIIGGAPKAGTTTLAEMLNCHPGIFIPPKKELFLFHHEKFDSTSYSNFFESSPPECMHGDATPTYLADPDSALRLKTHNPKALCIFVLRDPVERAWSHYLFDQQHLKIPNNTSLRRAIENQEIRSRVIGESMYGELIPRFADCIGRERILILFSSELRKSPDQTLRKALEFLGQEHLGIDIGDRSTNITRIPRAGVATLAYKSLYKFNAQVRKIFPKKVYTSNNWSLYDVLRSSVKSILTTRDKPRINPDDRKYLEDLFQASNSKLESFLGTPLPW